MIKKSVRYLMFSFILGVVLMLFSSFGGKSTGTYQLHINQKGGPVWIFDPSTGVAKGFSIIGDRYVVIDFKSGQISIVKK